MNIIATTYAVLRRELTEQTASAPWPSPEAGFLDYFQATINPNNVSERTLVTDRLDEAPMLASAGYQYANPRFIRPSVYDEEWARHFRRLAQRQAFPIDRESYFFRPLDLLGICIGARTCPTLTDEDRRWLITVLQQGKEKLPEQARAYYLGAVAASYLGVPWTIRAPRAHEAPLAELSLLFWITNQPALTTATELAMPANDLATQILLRALTAQEQYDDLADAGMILHATQTIVDHAISSRVNETWHTPLNARDASSLVHTICDRFQLAANSLAERYNQRPTITMSDEYDVQDLLQALLKVHFTDVRPEEWTPSYAGNASRIDFILKPEQIAIEAKMTRKGLNQKEIGNQLAIDILRYQTHPDCKTLVCFVYDPEGRCSNPTALENDLTQNHGNINVTVIVRPKHH